MNCSSIVASVLPLACSGLAIAQSVMAPFNSYYRAVDLGQMPSVASYGGLAFAPGDHDTLLVSPYGSGEIRAVRLQRDGQGNIVGFTGSALRAAVGGNDGGLAVGAGGVLLFTWYGANRLGQVLPSSAQTNRETDLQPLGVNGSVGSCAFVPTGRTGAGKFKLTSVDSHEWYDVRLDLEANGTYAVQAVSAPIALLGGPEAIVYPPTTAVLLGAHVLVAEQELGLVSAYRTDGNGDPIPSSRQPVMAGLGSPGGGAVDPVRGDLLFAHADGRLVALRWGAACGSATTYGVASPGIVTPSLTGQGCAKLGDVITLVATAAPGSPGVLLVGGTQSALWFGNLRVWTSLDLLLQIAVGGSGRLDLPFAIPNVPNLGNSHIYWQTALIDLSTPTGLTGSAGLDLWIR